MGENPVLPLKKRKRTIRKGMDRVVFEAIGYTIIFAFGMLCILPFLLIVVSSFTSESSLMRNGYSLFIKELSLEAYRLAFRSPRKILWAYRNTVCVTGIGTCIGVFVACMTGYVLQRKDFRPRNAFSFFFFFTMLFHGGLVPWYILCVRYLGFKNSYNALLLPLLFNVWNMIIAKNYMRSIPYEITESAKMDGANDLVAFLKLMMPLSTPLIATIGLFQALAYWNDWYGSMLFITKDEMVSLQYFLQTMLSSIEALKDIASRGVTIDVSMSLPQETMKMAMTVITIGPVILLYPYLQRFFVKGLTIGAVKG